MLKCSNLKICTYTLHMLILYLKLNVNIIPRVKCILNRNPIILTWPSDDPLGIIVTL